MGMEMIANASPRSNASPPSGVEFTVQETEFPDLPKSASMMNQSEVVQIKVPPPIKPVKSTSIRDDSNNEQNVEEGEAEELYKEMQTLKSTNDEHKENVEEDAEDLYKENH